MTSSAYLRLAGTRYRCVPKYLPFEEFDPLARLFLEVIRHERSLPRLLRAFGLAPRVIEDVIADLIRRNRATLVITENATEIRLLEDSELVVVHEPGPPLEVWQEEHTGFLLPASVVDVFRVAPSEDRTLAEDATDRVIEPFLTAHDAQLIETLVRADATLYQRDKYSGEIDRLDDRERLRPQTIWLPLTVANLHGRTFQLITSDRIPAFMARVWSAALRREREEPVATPVDFAALTMDETDADAVVHGWRLSRRVDTWKRAVDRFLHLVPAPIAGYDLRDVRDEEALVREGLLSIGFAELLGPASRKRELEWLEPVLDASRGWVAIALPWPKQSGSLLDRLARRLEEGRPLPATLIVVLPADADASSLDTALADRLGRARFHAVVRRQWPASWPALAVGDGGEVRMLSSPGAAVVQFRGTSLVTAWVSILQSLKEPPLGDADFAPDRAAADSRSLLAQLRVRRDLESESSAIRLGSSEEARAVTAALDTLSAFGNDLYTAIVDPEYLLGGDRPAAIEARHSVSAFDRGRSLREQLPELADRLDDLSYELALPPALLLGPTVRPAASWTRLASHDLPPTLVGILKNAATRPAEAAVYIVTRGASAYMSDEPFVRLLEAIVEQGRSVNIGLSKEGQAAGGSGKTQDALRTRLGSPRLRLWSLRDPAPASALVFEDMVFLTGGDWLTTVLDGPSGGEFGFALECGSLAAGFRRYFDSASEIRP